MNKKFRIQAKRIFLTYPQFNSTKEAIKEQLFHVLTNYLPFDYCISQETHENGNLHFHVYLQSKSKFDIKNANQILKLKELDGSFKSGDYKSVKGPTSFVLRYLTKEDKDPLTNISFDFDIGKPIDIEEQTLRIYENSGYDNALTYARSNIIKLRNGYNRIRTTLNNLRKDDSHLNKLRFLPFDMQLLSSHPIKSQLTDWHENHLDKTLYLSGPSGIGKTEFMKAFLASLFGSNKIAFIRHLEDLKSINLDNKDVFLFDDLALFKIFKKSPEELIHFLDRHNPSPIRVLYGICTLKDKVVVVTHNIPFDTGLDKLKFEPEQKTAIQRRVTSVKTGSTPLPLAFPTADNINELKSNSDIYHPDWKELEIDINKKKGPKKR